MAKKKAAKPKKAPFKTIFIRNAKGVEDIEKLDLPDDVKAELIRTLKPVFAQKKEVTISGNPSGPVISGDGTTCESGCCARVTLIREDKAKLTVGNVVSTLAAMINELQKSFQPDVLMEEVVHGPKSANANAPH